MNTTVERARRGDAAAFEALYHEHAGWVFALARRMADDETLARDMAQEIFVGVGKGTEPSACANRD